MECPELDDDIYKGKIIEMKNNNKKNKDTNDNYVVPKLAVRILIGISGLCGTFIIGIGGWILIQLYNLNSTVNLNTTDIASIRDDVDSITVGLHGDANNNGIYTRLALIEQKLGYSTTTTISLSDEAQSFIPNFSTESKNISFAKSSIASGLTVGLDSNGNLCNTEDLVNKQILLKYNEDNKEIYFLGQYNQNYNWDGYCVRNVYYPNGELFGIYESTFEDGICSNYKSLYKSKSSEEWIYTNRFSNSNENHGISKSYEYKQKILSIENIKASDIIYIDDFIKNENLQLLTYYSGLTSNQLYNDSTGNAFQIEYNDDGTVKHLYVGRLKNGKFEDKTGTAEGIFLDSYEEELKYFHYVGTFSNNKNDKPFKTDDIVTQKDIDDFVEKNNIDIGLNWYPTE